MSSEFMIMGSLSLVLDLYNTRELSYVHNAFNLARNEATATATNTTASPLAGRSRGTRAAMPG